MTRYPMWLWIMLFFAMTYCTLSALWYAYREQWGWCAVMVACVAINLRTFYRMRNE